MKKEISRDKNVRRLASAALDELIDQITVDAYGEQEQLWAFRQAFEDNVPLPAEGSVVGEPVAVVAFDYDGNERRGLTAKCGAADGREHIVAAADVMIFPSVQVTYNLATSRICSFYVFTHCHYVTVHTMHNS